MTNTHAYDAQVDSLDKMQEAYEKEKDREIKVLEDSISSAEKVYQLAIARISNGWDTLYQSLISWNTQYGSVTNDTISEAWANASLAVQQYGGYINALLETQNQLAMLTEKSTYGGSGYYSSGSSDSTNAPTSLGPSKSSNYDTSGSAGLAQIRATVAEMKANSQAWAAADKSGNSGEKSRLSERNGLLGAKLEEWMGTRVWRDEASGVWWFDDLGTKKKLFDVYHKGGIAGGAPTVRDNEVFSLLEKGEAVLDENKKRAVYKIVDFGAELAEKFGLARNALDSFSALGKVDMSRLQPRGYDLADVSRMAGEFTFNVDVNVSGSMTGAEAMQTGRKIGDGVIERLNDAAARRGLRSLMGKSLR